MTRIRWKMKWALTSALTSTIKWAIAAGWAFLPGVAASRAQVPRVDHVFIEVEENQDFRCVIGNSTMSLFDGLASKYAVADSFYGDSHTSISNYLVLTNGQVSCKGRIRD